MSTYESLTLALEGHFDTALADLPEALRQRIESEFFPMPWEKLDGDARRSVALQLDYQRDPATEADRQFWWDFFERMHELQTQIAEWESKETPTASDKEIQERRLRELKRKLGRMKRQQQVARGDYYPEHKAVESPGEPAVSHDEYIAYPKAMQSLVNRLGATPEELAAWVFLGPELGGIAAYRNANELIPPPRFHFNCFMDEDYVAPMMACWFRGDDIENFSPADRYITGAALIERWSRHRGMRANAFVRAKIAESRLIDIHPLYGGTTGSHPEGDSFPATTEGLFAVRDIERIEAEDGIDIAREQPGGEQERLQPVDADSDAESPHGEDTCAVFRSLENLCPNEIAIAIVGDTSEAGLAGNNLLEISARGISKRISLGEFGLLDRRTGALNQQAAVLVGLARGARMSRTKESIAATMKRLRAQFRARLGLKGDPFATHRPDVGWQPLFSIVDLRGRAEERAKEQAERRTLSFDQMQEQGHQFSANDTDSADEENAADKWMTEHNHLWDT